jgi:hypothetical protein
MQSSSGLVADLATSSDVELVGDEDGACYMCVLIEASRIGIAYYNAGAESLHVASAYCSDDDVPWVSGILREQVASPVVMVTGPATSEAARRELSLRIVDGGVIEGGIELKVLKQTTCESQGS